jgi:GIY-YIG catalytic domain
MADPGSLHIIHPEGADLAGAGIYLWSVEGHTYVGKATCLRSRLNEYLNNIKKIEAGQPYRRSNPEGFRAVHRHLAQAKARGAILEWKLLEVCPRGEALLMRERHWIKTLSPTLNGPMRGRSL